MKEICISATALKPFSSANVCMYMYVCVWYAISYEDTPEWGTWGIDENK